MIEQIIMKLKEDLIQNKDAEALYTRYMERKQLEQQINDLESEKEVVESQNSDLDSQLVEYNFFQRLFNKRKILNIKQQNDTKLAEIRKSVELDKQSYNNVELSVEELAVVDEYVRVLDMEKDFSSGRYDEVVDGILKVFNFDFRNLISFCTLNGIILDFSQEIEIDFLDKFIERKRETMGDYSDKYSSLDDLMLVRSITVIPENDTLVPASKTYFKEYEGSINYDDREYTYKYKIPVGHTTIHFFLNQEVLPHKDAADGWKHCDKIIMQPLTEKLYNRCVGFCPCDLVFENEVELENYLMICDSVETAYEITQKNKKVTVFIFPKGKVYGSANKILGCLGFKILYKLFDNAFLDMSLPPEKFYSQELLTKYPRLATDLTRGPGNLIHDFSPELKGIYENIYSLDFLIQLASKEDNLEVAIYKILELRLHCGLSISTLKEGDIKLSSLIIPEFRDIALFLDDLNDFDLENIENLEIQNIFERIISGVEITLENRDAMLLIKKILISVVENYVELRKKNDVLNVVSSSNLIFKLFVLRKIVTSELINKKDVNSFANDEFLEYCDFSNLDNIVNKLILNDFSEGEDLSSLLKNIFTHINSTNSNLYEFKLSSPDTSCFATG